MAEKKKQLAVQGIKSASSAEKVQTAILEDEMRNSYLDYAMSVIVSRALPDVRDGLKPVHRRILFAMHGMGLRYNTKFRKSATVVGEVLGKYHPHGDSAVYDAMVRMAQDFSMRYPLVKGQGNFGSIDGDPPAAQRYTEAKMAKITDLMLSDIEKKTVGFIDNYDASRREPKVLPGRVPNLLVNGTLGIAVGMATYILPHNLSEVCDALMALIKNPDMTIEDLTQIILGPDFPTGATIYDQQSMQSVYSTGRGPIVCRGEAEIMEEDRRKKIIISSIPYQINKSDLVSKIAALVKNKKIEGISDLRDESDRRDGIRIVIELKASAFAKKILNQLYKLTSLQTVFHMNMVALVNGLQPRLLSLKDILAEYIKHRRLVIVRRTRFDLQTAQERAHILEGLKKALDFIDQVISTIRDSATKELAHKNLIIKFRLSDKQAQAILEMKLSALAGLERQKVLDELKEKFDLIRKLKSILASRAKIFDIIARELKELKEIYGDGRRTKIFKSQIGKFEIEDLVPDEKVIVTLTHGNYVKRVPIDTYHSQGRGGKGIKGMETKDEDSVMHLVSASTHDDVMFFTNLGKIYQTKVYEIPGASRVARGHSVANIISLGPDEMVTALLAISKIDKTGKFLFFATKQGRVKKTLISAYDNVRKNGIIAIKLARDDELQFVKITDARSLVIMVTQNGQGILFRGTDVRPMGRGAAGVRGMKLRVDDQIIATDIVSHDEDPDLLTILKNGFGKRTIIKKHFKLQKRGGLGVRASKVNMRTGKLVQALVIRSLEGDVVLASAKGTIIRLPIKSVKRLGRATQGVTLMRFKGTDSVSSVGVILADPLPNLILSQPKSAPVKSSVAPLPRTLGAAQSNRVFKPKTATAFKTKTIVESNSQTKTNRDQKFKKTATFHQKFIRKKF